LLLHRRLRIGRPGSHGRRPSRPRPAFVKRSEGPYIRWRIKTCLRVTACSGSACSR